MNTPRFANTNPPAIGAPTIVVGAYFYTDNDHLCHFRVLDLTYLPRSATNPTQSSTPMRSTTSPYKRRQTRQTTTSSQESPAAPEATTSPRSRVQRALPPQTDDTPGASSSSNPPPDNLANLLSTSDYIDDLPTDEAHKRKQSECDDNESEKKKGKGKRSRPSTFSLPHTLLSQLTTAYRLRHFVHRSPIPFTSFHQSFFLYKICICIF